MKYIVLLLLFTCVPLWSTAQNSINYREFKDLFKTKEHKHNWGHYLKESKNELNFVFSFLFIAYKEIFSSQDIDACVFTPSCSVYAIETIKTNGAIIGTFDAFDRISRCNPGRNKHHPIDKKTGKFFDPVKGINRKP